MTGGEPIIGRDDLRAAVAAGHLTEAQAAALVALADSRRGARAAVASGDEPFELFRGFNEVFIVTGLVILALGWWGVVGVWVTGSIGNPFARTATAALLGGVLLLLLSEYFIRRRRMVAPSITLALFFAANAVIGCVAWLGRPFLLAQADYGSLPLPIALAVGLLALWWLRYRVPFALALIALGIFAAALVTASVRSGTPESPRDLFLLSAGGPFAWITLALGLAAFAAALAFDMSDPHRVTRRAANGFWLHLVAAPMLVNTIALTLLGAEGPAPRLLLLAFLGLIAVAAIVIDRRSFLIAAVGYCVALAGAVFEAGGAVWTTLALGVLLLLLGAFWERIRARLLSALPFLPRSRLPPSA